MTRGRGAAKGLGCTGSSSRWCGRLRGCSSAADRGHTVEHGWLSVLFSYFFLLVSVGKLCVLTVFSVLLGCDCLVAVLCLVAIFGARLGSLAGGVLLRAIAVFFVDGFFISLIPFLLSNSVSSVGASPSAVSVTITISVIVTGSSSMSSFSSGSASSPSSSAAATAVSSSPAEALLAEAPPVLASSTASSWGWKATTWPPLAASRSAARATYHRRIHD